jgi:hypothetical protein
MFNYDPNLNTNRDKIRITIQDTDSYNPFFQDEELQGLENIHGSWRNTAVVCCELLAIKFANEADSKKVGELHISLKEKAKRYQELAKVLRRQLFKFAQPYAGGISDSDAIVNEMDTDIIQPSFKRKSFENKTTLDSDNVNSSR